MTNYLQIMYKKISIKIIMILVTAAIVTVPSWMFQLSHAQPNQDMQEVLDIHNRERADVNFPALTWSDSLTTDAQKWANHLTTLGIVCGSGGCKPTTPHGATNENIASGYVYPAELGRTSPAEYTQMWVDEKVAYNGGQRSGLGIGRSAMVWKATTQVGCWFAPGAVRWGRLGGGTDFLGYTTTTRGKVVGRTHHLTCPTIM